ncbi:MAG TPA: urease accessory protein UreD [Burkholderiales bacterium]
MAAAAGVARGAWHGRLDLAFVRRGHRTVLERRTVRMPLALQRPFYPEGPAVCHVLVLHPPGGMVGGDRLDIALDAEAGAQAMVTTPSAAKWYRGLATARQTVRLRLASDSRIEWLPQETIVYAGAEVRQELRVELAPGAVWLGWDITRFGRTARGETYAHGTWRTCTEVWRADEPLWIDRQRLDGGGRALQGAFGLGGNPVLGTFAWVGKRVSAELVQAARDRWAAVGQPGDAGVTRLPEGLLCRYRGASSAAARAWFIEVWRLVRAHDGRTPAVPARIWST